jgi:hypothetical protein
MTLTELDTAFRERADDVATPYLWSLALVLQYANEAQNEANRRSRLLGDTTTAAVCQIPIVAGTSTYAVDPRVLFIRRVQLGTQDFPLQKYQVGDLDRSFPGWERSTDVSSPEVWCPVEDHKIRLVPTPDANDTLYLHVIRDPLAPMSYAAQATAAAVSGITLVGSVATAVLTVPNPLLVTGDSVTFAGAGQTEYNGAHTVTVIDSSTVSYTVGGTPATPATGTITYAKNTPAVDPEIPARYQFKLVDWILYRAFMQRDRQDKYNPEEATARLNEFEAEFGKRSTAVDETWINRMHGQDEFEGLF